jgi:small-conductance mechanosensitive channel
MTEFGDSSVNFEISVWLRNPWLHRAALSNLNEAIWHALKANKVTIPFPQRDVHLIPPPAPRGAPPSQPEPRADEASDPAR